MTWFRAFFAFREANHTELVKALRLLPKYPGPRPKLMPITASAKVVSLDTWMRLYAPDHKREVA